MSSSLFWSRIRLSLLSLTLTSHHQLLVCWMRQEKEWKMGARKCSGFCSPTGQTPKALSTLPKAVRALV